MLENLGIFGFRALWSPYFFLLTLLIAIAYLFIISSYGKRKFDNYSEVKLSQKIYFLSAIVLLYVIKGGPIDLLGHLNFSMHMTQMAILYLTIPPLLILGTPEWLFKALLKNQKVKRIFLFFTKPIIALLLFNGIFSLYHYPLIFDTVKTDPLLHGIYTFILFLLALAMWWPLLNPVKSLPQLSGLQKIGYIFADSVLLTPACALIIFSPVAFYSTYTDPAVWAQALELCVPASTLSTIDLSQPQMFSWLPPRDDQQLGGVIMKIIQEIMYGIILGYNFFQWVKDQREKDDLETSQLMASYVTK